MLNPDNANVTLAVEFPLTESWKAGPANVRKVTHTVVTSWQREVYLARQISNLIHEGALCHWPLSMAANAYITANIISTFNSTQIGNDHEGHKIEKLFGGRDRPRG